MARAKAPQLDAEVYTAQSTGVIKIDGKLHRYIEGRSYSRNHPVVRRLPERFAPLSLEFMDPPRGEVVA